MTFTNFIKRPVLSTVISILIVILGIIGLLTLPIEQYPDVAPPTVSVRTTYTGADAETVKNSVLAPLEESINGVENMDYMESSADNSGSASITIYFRQGANADMCAVNVQNRISQAQSQLPAEVTRVGVTVNKRQSSQVIMYALVSPDGRYDDEFITNYNEINVVPALKRIEGVGDVMSPGMKTYSMRIWLKPDKMKQYGLMPSDISNALAEQNIEAAPGTFGEQSKLAFEYVMRYTGRLKTPEQFQNIILTSDLTGQTLKLKDVADVELGGLSYTVSMRNNNMPSVMGMVQQIAGSNANNIATDVKAQLETLSKDFPPGLTYDINYDVTSFLYASIHEVVFTLVFTLVLVSFSCTAPIVGTVLVEAARGSILRPIVGMLGFSIAVALPFGFFAFFPSKLNNLPKSGGWLNSVKVVLGFIEVALGFKFLMVADQTYHWGLLDREIYIAIWIAIFTLQGLYLMGKIKFANDSDLPYIGVPRLIFIIITFTFVIYLIPGMFGAPLKALAGYLPPQESIDFDINRIVRENAKNIMESGVQVKDQKSGNASSGETVKYSEFLHLPHGLDGYFDYDQALKAAQEQDKPLFIDFTGHGCVNCREMEQAVWSDPRVLEMLRNDYVVVALYVDDKTKLPEEEWYVSEYDGKKKKELGKKNADFQIKNFDSNAQPNYILLDSRHGKDKDLRPHVLAPARGHNLDRDAFVKFLQDGLKAYKERGNK